MGSVVVIGAGISGLTVAWRLHRAGVSVTVLEKEPHPGGTMRTVNDGNWMIESGPNSALETTPLFQQLFAELGIVDQLRYANSAADKRYIMRNGKLHALPMSPGAFLSSSLWTVGGKLRLLKEPFIGKADKEETIAEFVERRLGREFLDYAINPFVAGVYAGNPEQLSVRSAFPKLYALEEKYGGLVKGMIKGRRERKARAEKAKDRAKMFSFVKGMGTFPETIVRQLADTLQYNCVVESVRRNAASNGRGKAFSVSYSSQGTPHSIAADAVVLSAPARSASGIVRTLAPDLSTTLGRIYYPPVVEVFLGYKKEQVGIPLDGFGFLIPAVEKRKILGTIWSSVLFEGRSPAECAAFTTFLGGARQPELAQLNDTEVLSIVRSELGSIMNVTGSPAYVRINRWNKAIPQYNLGHSKVVQEIEKCEKENPGLYFCSNYRGGISVGDCIMSSDKTSSEVLAHLKNSIHQPISVDEDTVRKNTTKSQRHEGV
jgi:protoporphyrinogen/coproporphyrinogen III oxidase